MCRFVPLLLGMLGSVALVTAAAAAPAPSGTPVLVSGQNILAIIDGNGDGPGLGDCDFMATLNNFMVIRNGTSADLAIFAMQDQHTPLRACAGGYSGNASRMGNVGEVNITGSTIPAGSLPLMATLLDNRITISDGAQGAGTLLCNDAGLAARVSVGNQMLLVGLSFFPSAGMPQFLKIPHLPLQLWTNLAAGSFSFFDAYIPVTPDKHVTLALSNAPGDLLLDIDLNGLPGCARLVPTATGWGLMLLTMTLLAIAAWRLGLRPGYQSLAML
jgi:hypothetical protein